MVIPDDGERLNPTGFDLDFDPVAFQWAAMYRASGLQVVPCKDKRPDLHQWAGLQKELAPDFTFERWYGPKSEHADNRNMGVITGPCSRNLFVIDLDIHKKPAAQVWWDSIIEGENSGLEPETCEQRTGGGGRQIFFFAPDGVVIPTCRTEMGVDIRGTGGFAVLPPTLHQTGNKYMWLPLAGPWERPIAVAEPWLIQAVCELAEAYGGSTAAPAQRTASPGEDYTALGLRQNGREEEMRNVIFRAVLELYRAAPIQPFDAASAAACQEAYALYESRVVTRIVGAANRSAGLEQEGRGWTAFQRKWAREMRLWGSPKMVREAAKPAPAPTGPKSPHLDPQDFAQAAQTAQTKADVYELLDVKQIKAMPHPRWLVAGLIIEEALGFIYGPPGCLKTFIGLDIALSLSTGMSSWWGRSIQRGGAVIYISSEGQGDLKYRIMAWEENRGVKADDSSFRLIRQSINFMKVEDVGKLLATVQAVVDAVGPVAAVFVDTVSRVLPGANENLQEDMTIFVAACDAVRQRFGATVIGLHHTARAGNMRGSTVIPGAGDFVIEVRREPGALDGSIFASKIKAAEDGWEQFFVVKKFLMPTTLATTSLALDTVAEQHSPPGPVRDKLPDREILRQILAAIAEQWFKKQPWCFARNTSRCATTNIMRRWRLDRKLVDGLLADWVANGVVAEEIIPGPGHVRGYRKLIDL